MLSDEQQLLAQTTRRFIDESCPIEVVRRHIDGGRELAHDYLRSAADLGWFGIFVPEALGGGTVSGAAAADATVIAELRGRGLQPGPFTFTNVVAAAVAELGTEKQQVDLLPGLVSGDALATWAVADDRGEWGTGGVQAVVRGESFVLTGAKSLVQDLDHADWLLVAAAVGGSPMQFIVPTNAVGVAREQLESLDLTRRFGRVTFDSVVVPADAVLGEVSAASRALARQLDLGATLAVAEAVGAMSRLFELTLDYAKDRVAFGRPIGSFQAIKHLLADMSLLLEASKGALVAAADAVDRRSDEASEVVSLVKSYVGDASTEVAQGCLQIHGGIGYTWEHDVHLFYRRLAGDLMLLGDPTWHRERVCSLHGL